MHRILTQHSPLFQRNKSSFLFWGRVDEARVANFWPNAKSRKQRRESPLRKMEIEVWYYCRVLVHVSWANSLASLPRVAEWLLCGVEGDVGVYCKFELSYLVVYPIELDNQ